MRVADWLQMTSLLAVATALVLNVYQNRSIARQTNEMIVQSKAAARSVELSAYHRIVASEFDLSDAMRQDPAALRWHLSSKGYPASDDNDANVRTLYSLRKINEHESVFLSRAAGLVDDDLWVPWQRVLERDLAVPEFRNLLPNARKYFATSFVEFIDSLVRGDDEDRATVEKLVPGRSPAGPASA